jgi:hypothetical protein
MINGHFLETAGHCGQPIHSVHYGLGRTGRTADYFFELQGGLSAKATPEPNIYRSNLRSS